MRVGLALKVAGKRCLGRGEMGGSVGAMNGILVMIRNVAFGGRPKTFGYTREVKASGTV
jgi:hypothetical protein